MYSNLYLDIEYWKIQDLFKIQHGEEHLANKNLPICVYKDNPTCDEYHAVQPRFDTIRKEWTLKTALYSKKELDEWKYYHFTGLLDDFDFLTEDEDRGKEVDLIVLARSEKEVIKLASYSIGEAHWHLGSPYLQLLNSYEDECRVIKIRINSWVMDCGLNWMI